jgi:hypothetical protein
MIIMIMISPVHIERNVFYLGCKSSSAMTPCARYHEVPFSRLAIIINHVVPEQQYRLVQSLT